MNADETVLDHLTEQIIGSALTVSNAIGAGFLEVVYENAVAHEVRKTGLTVVQQRGGTGMYDGVIVSDYAYLRATRVQFCLPLNFGKPRLEIKRIPGLRRGWQSWACEALTLSAFIGG